MIAAFVASTLFLACYLTYHGYLAYYLHRGPTALSIPPVSAHLPDDSRDAHLLAVVIVPLAVTTLYRP